MFLNDNGLSKLYPTLMNKDIDFETLSLINDQDLRKLGFSLGQCIKIKKAIQEIDTQQSQNMHDGKDDEPVQSLIPLAERDDEVIDVASENQLKKNNTYEEQHNKESPEADPDNEENFLKKKALIGVSIFFIILILILGLIFGLGLFGIINIPFVNILMNPTNTTLSTSLMTTTMTPTTMTSTAMKLSTTTTQTNATSKS